MPLGGLACVFAILQRRIPGIGNWMTKLQGQPFLAYVCMFLAAAFVYLPLLSASHGAWSYIRIPAFSYPKQYRDFSAATAYAGSFGQLLTDIRDGKGVSPMHQFRATYVTAPPLPVNFVERPDALDALRRVLITDDSGPHIALTAVKGRGGIGKTVLAQALCHDEVVQQAFPDGIIWVSIGKANRTPLVRRTPRPNASAWVNGRPEQTD